MNLELYSETVKRVSTVVAEAVLQIEPDIAKSPLLVDGIVRHVVQQVGLHTTAKVLNTLADHAVAAAREQGFFMDELREVEITTVFGSVAVSSPRMRTGRGRRLTCRPVADQLGLTAKARTPAVERALVDFGAEESFGKAAKRFEEHYGFEYGRTSVLRIVHEHAAQAEKFVAAKLAKAEVEYDKPLVERPGVPLLFGGVDGHMLRTGKLEATNDGRQSAVRKLPKRKRETSWRETRVATVHPAGEVDATYVAGMESYPVICKKLFGAACHRGLSDASLFVCTADGGNGLRDEVEATFVKRKFVLDKMHVVQHLSEGADAMGKSGDDKRAWLAANVSRISKGDVSKVIAELRRHDGNGKEEARVLANYLHKFRACVHYDAYAQRGWPIGSGRTESAHRSVSQERMKLPGTWWAPESINRMMALRVLRENGWWKEYWDQAEKVAAA